MLRISVSHFPPNSLDIALWVAKLKVALYLDTIAKKRKCKFRQLFHFPEWGSNLQQLRYSHTLVLLRPNGLIEQIFFYNYYLSINNKYNFDYIIIYRRKWNKKTRHKILFFVNLSIKLLYPLVPFVHLTNIIMCLTVLREFSDIFNYQVKSD